MRIVDTSAWIEWLVNGRNFDAIAKQLPSEQEWVVPTIVQMELRKWALWEVGTVKAREYIAFSNQRQIVPLDTMIAVRAAKLSRDKSLATRDAIIYTTAIALKADLLTCDAHFKDLPGVIYIEK